MIFNHFHRSCFQGQLTFRIDSPVSSMNTVMTDAMTTRHEIMISCSCGQADSLELNLFVSSKYKHVCQPILISRPVTASENYRCCSGNAAPSTLPRAVFHSFRFEYSPMHGSILHHIRRVLTHSTPCFRRKQQSSFGMQNT